jgi:ABC-2 type transport system permease protein
VSVVTRPEAIAGARPATPPSGRAALRAVVRRGLRDNRRTPLTWGGPLAVMSALIAALWPSIEGSVDQLMESYPDDLKEAFNIRALTSVETYFDAEMLSFIIPLALAFLAVRVVVRMLSGAEERGYLDIVLTAPVARRTLVAGAMLVAGAVVAAVLAITAAATWLAGTLVGADPSFAVIGRGLLNVWPLAMLFAGLSALVCGRAHSGGPVTAIAAGTLIGMYVIDLVGKLADPAEPLRYLSAFRYYGSAIQDGIDPAAFAGLAVVAAALAAAGAWLLERRDVLWLPVSRVCRSVPAAESRCTPARCARASTHGDGGALDRIPQPELRARNGRRCDAPVGADVRPRHAAGDRRAADGRRADPRDHRAQRT